MPQAEFSAHRDELEAVLVVRGEIDIATADDFRRNLRSVVEGSGDRSIVIDLEDVTFLDSSGLEVLVDAQTAVTPRRFTLRRTSVPVRRVLELTGTLDRFLLE